MRNKVGILAWKTVNNPPSTKLDKSRTFCESIKLLQKKVVVGVGAKHEKEIFGLEQASTFCLYAKGKEMESKKSVTDLFVAICQKKTVLRD